MSISDSSSGEPHINRIVIGEPRSIRFYYPFLYIKIRSQRGGETDIDNVAPGPKVAPASIAFSAGNKSSWLEWYGCLQVRYDEALPVCPSSVTWRACNIQLCRPCVLKQFMITCPRRVLGRVHFKLQCHAILAKFCFPSALPFSTSEFIRSSPRSS